MYQTPYLKAWTPDPDIDFVAWANENFYLAREAAAEYGPYRSSRTPFVEEPLRELSPNSDTQIVVVVKPTQCAGTTIALIFLCGIAAIAPGPTLFMMPTDSMCRSFSKKKLSTCIKQIDALKGKISEPKSRDSSNTIMQKDFDGGSWMLSGSNSGASFRSESIKYLILDDFDGFEADIDGEGSPEELADRRTGSFPNRKIYINSTTTVKGFSNIEKAYDASSQGLFCVPCPHCNHYQYLRWGDKEADWGIKFARDDDGQVVDAWYQCEECHERIDESRKEWMNANYLYIHKYPNRRVRGFKWNALNTPVGWINDWRYIAQKFCEAIKALREGSPEKYKTWLNSFMSESYEDKGEQPEWSIIKARCEPYQPLTVPEKARILTAGVDVHPDRLPVSIYAWGPGEECWLVYHVEIFGDVLQPDVWNQLDQLLFRNYSNPSGAEYQIVSAGIDAGDGNTTQAVRNYCRTRFPRVFALKGASTANKPIIGVPTKQDVTWKGEKIPNGVELWPIGTDTAKQTLYARLKNGEPGPGYTHFYIGLEDEFFMQLTAEKIVTRFVKGYPVREWHNVRGNKRNEALDNLVYAYAAAVRAGITFIDLQQPVKRKIKKREQATVNPYTQGVNPFARI
jgi:terminase, large subunit